MYHTTCVLCDILCFARRANITGTRSPRIEKQKAPIKPINGEISGTATANSTAAVTSTVLYKQ